MRLYLPTTLAELRGWLDAAEVPAGADRVVAENEAEDSEYAALMTAADRSTELLGGAGGRRVVLVAELPDRAPTDATLPQKVWAAVHADPADRPAGADPDEDLAWYAIQELEALLG